MESLIGAPDLLTQLKGKDRIESNVYHGLGCT